MTRILITGARGALGRAVVAELQNNTRNQIFVTTTENSVNSSVITCDLCDQQQITAAFEIAQPDLILHLGASFTDDISAAYLVNVLPAKYFLDLIKTRKMRTRIVLIGSAAEYGMVNPEENPIREDHALFPMSVYGVSKAWQTQLLGLYANQVDVVCARIFNLYGDGLSERLFAGRLQTQIAAIKSGLQSSIQVGSLNSTRDFISTNDAARQLILIANRGVTGEIYHIASGIPITMRDFLLNQLELNGLSSSLVQESSEFSNRRGYDVPIIFANMTKTRNLET